MHLDQTAHERQADAQAALRAPAGSIDLHEHVEHRSQVSRRDTDAVVAYRDHRPAAFA
jgi:hypothetical protein